MQQQKVVIKGFSFGNKNLQEFKVMPITSSPIQFKEQIITMKKDQNFHMEFQTSFKDIAWKIGDLIGIAKVPTKEEKDADIRLSLPLDFSKDLSTSKKVSKDPRLNKQSTSNSLKKLAKNPAKDLFVPDLIVETGTKTKNSKDNTGKKSSSKDSNRGKYFLII